MDLLKFYALTVFYAALQENLGCGCVTNEENNECCKVGCLRGKYYYYYFC